MTTITKKRKLVADGVFYAELHDFLQREVGESGYSGVEVRVTPVRTEIIVRATKTQDVLGVKGRRIRELTSLIQKRFNFPEDNVILYCERVNNRALCALTQAESLAHKLEESLPVRRACYGVMRFVMDNGAKGVEVTVSGKLRGQRAKSMKFRDGYMIKSGNPTRYFCDVATRHIEMKQGVLGIRVKVMLSPEQVARQYGKKLADKIEIREPKSAEGHSYNKGHHNAHGQNVQNNQDNQGGNNQGNQDSRSDNRQDNRQDNRNDNRSNNNQGNQGNNQGNTNQGQQQGNTQ